MKNILKIGLFILIFVILWNCVFMVLTVQKNSVGLFYDEPKNSLDVMYYGSSSAYAFYNTSLAYSEYGYTTGMMSSDGQPFIALKYLIKEAHKYQNPQVDIIDIDCISFGVGDISEGDIRRVIDNMNFSKNKIDLTTELLKYYQNGEIDKLSYYLSFLYYHSSWKDISMEKIKPTKIFKGTLLSDMTVSISPQEKTEWVEGEQAIEGNDLKVFNDLIKYIKDEKINAVFVIPKRTMDIDAMQRFNYVTRIANENGIKVLNFNNVENFEVDYEKDFYNKSHLNTRGSIKHTLYLADYLKRNYDLPDHRKDEQYKSWDEAYNKYKIRYQELTNQSFDYLLEEVRGVQ